MPNHKKRKNCFAPSNNTRNRKYRTGVNAILQNYQASPQYHEERKQRALEIEQTKKEKVEQEEHERRLSLKQQYFTLFNNMSKHPFYSVPTLSLGGHKEHPAGELCRFVAEYLKEHPEITTLELSGCNLNDEDIAIIITQLSHLTRLRIGENPQISVKGFRQLARLSRLDDLSVGDHKMDENSLSAIAQLPLSRLFLTHSHLNDDGLAILKQMSCLREIHICENPEISSKGLDHLAKLPLTCLWAHESKLDDKSAHVIGKMANLTALYVGFSNITAIGIAAFRLLSKLEVLEIPLTNLGDEGAQALQELTQLRELDVEATGLSGSGAALLAQMNLEYLHIRDNPIYDPGAVSLLKNRSLLRLGVEADNLISPKYMRLLRHLPAYNKRYQAKLIMKILSEGILPRDLTLPVLGYCFSGTEKLRLFKSKSDNSISQKDADLERAIRI